MWYLFTLFLFGSAFAAEGDQEVLNAKVDNYVSTVSRELMSAGFWRVQIPDLGVDAAPVLITVHLVNATAFKRHDDAEVYEEDNVIIARIPMVYPRVRLTVDLVPYMHGNMTWDIKNLTFDVSVEVIGKGSDCRTNFKYIKIQDLGEISQKSSNSQYNDQKPNSELLKLIKPQYNRQFSKPEIMSVLNKVINLC